MLASISTGSPAMMIGCRRASRIRSAVCCARRAQTRQQHRELVAAESDKRLGVDAAGTQPVRHRRQQPVAGLVPERVVDLLEVVQVQQQHRGGATFRRRGEWARGGQHALGHLGEQQPISQPGQRIVPGTVLTTPLPPPKHQDHREGERHRARGTPVQHHGPQPHRLVDGITGNLHLDHGAILVTTVRVVRNEHIQGPLPGTRGRTDDDAPLRLRLRQLVSGQGAEAEGTAGVGVHPPAVGPRPDLKIDDLPF
jgi:hypothetical protein